LRGIARNFLNGRWHTTLTNRQLPSNRPRPSSVFQRLLVASELCEIENTTSLWGLQIELKRDLESIQCQLT
jgi:hypothetical protein